MPVFPDYAAVGSIPIKVGPSAGDWGYIPLPAGAGGTLQAGLTRTGVKTSAYNAQPGDLVPCDITSGGFTVTLPTAPAQGATIGVRVVLPSTLGANVLTIATGGSDVFSRVSGPTTATIFLPGQAQTYQYDKATAIWTPLADGYPLSQLDLRYPAIVAKVASADATTTGQALTDITGLTAAVLAASTYEFEAILKTVASADTNGMEVGVACTQTLVSVAALVSGNTATTTTATVAIIAAATATAAFNTSNAGLGIIRIKGQFITHATLAGTFSIQHLKVTSGTSTVKVGSTLKLTKVA